MIYHLLLARVYEFIVLLFIEILNIKCYSKINKAIYAYNYHKEYRGIICVQLLE